MGPSKMLKCHGCHGDFYGVPNSFGNHVSGATRSSVRRNAVKETLFLDLWEESENDGL